MGFVYLTFSDFDTNIREELRRCLVDDNDLPEIELRAVEMAKTSLRRRYEINEIFSKKGEKRNPELIYHLVNMVVYFAMARVIPRQIPETRSQLFEDSREFFRRASKPSDHPDAIFPDLPILQEVEPGRTFSGNSGRKYSNKF